MKITSYCNIRSQIENELRLFLALERDEWGQMSNQCDRSSIRLKIKELSHWAATHPLDCELCSAEMKEFSSLLSRESAQLSSSWKSLEGVDAMRAAPLSRVTCS